MSTKVLRRLKLRA